MSEPPKDGKHVVYYDNGQKKSEGNLKNGKADGLVTWWYDNGQTSAEGEFQNGERAGLWQFWHANGQKKSEGHYKDGEPDGPFTLWHENGQKQAEGHYKNGESDGLWNWWYENGQKEQEANYKNGEPDGLVTFWDEKGQRLESNSHETGLEDGKPKFYFLRIALVGIVFAGLLFTGIGGYPLFFMLVLSAAIGVHELGHLIAAKIAGIPITTFRIGFGPRLVCIRWLEVNWELGSIPVLGYVVPSELPEPASDSLRDRLSAKLKTLFFFSGGVAVNFLIAIAISWAQNPQEGVINASIQTSKVVGYVYLIIPEATWDMIRPKNIIADQKGIIREFASEQKDASPVEKRENYIRMLWILNIVMVAFNLFPFPGLDGFRILTTVLECFIPGGLPEGLKVGIGCISIVFILGLSAIGAFWMVRDVFMIFVDQPPENGQHVEYFESGEIKTETHYKNGKKQGPETAWHENGQTSAEGEFQNGERAGLWQFWHANGQKKEEGHYKDGKPDKLVTRWHENGQKEAEFNFKDGKQDGLWTGWDKNGRKKGEGHWKNGEPDGPFTLWHENGQKKQEIHYKNGKRDGLWTYWYKNGQKKSETHYKNGGLDGPLTDWYENGGTSRVGQYNGGELTSTSIWKPNGTPCPETTFVDGSGIIVLWHDNEQKKREGHFENGKNEGRWTWWHKNGQKERVGHYSNSKEDRLWTEWDENGNKTLEIQYKDGKEVSRKEF